MTASTNPLTDSPGGGPGEGPNALNATDTVSAGLIRVALDLPLPRLFDYLCPGVSSNDLGRRVVVPFGRKQMLGLIVELPTVSDMDPAKLRPADTVLRDIPALGADWLALAQFCASYYQKPLGEVVMNALPPRLRRVQALAAPATVWQITDSGRAALPGLPARSAAQRRVLEQLLDRARTAAACEPPPAAVVMARLRHNGWIAPLEEVIDSQGISDSKHSQKGTGGGLSARLSFTSSHPLNAEQSAAITALQARLGSYSTSLLFGITGSGKTEVYLHLAAEVLARGQQVLILVPEIALTPTLARTLGQRFDGARIAVQTSAMSDMARTRDWLAAQSGQADIVLGTRLAVFCPMPRLGLIVVDEEQDASFKQQESLRYSARDCALVRARNAGVPVVLASATPSLETWQHAKSGRYLRLDLTGRAHRQAAPPVVRMLDSRRYPVKDGLSEPLCEALQARLQRGEQSLIFLNRRGYAPVLACPACAWVSGCPRCSANLVVHLGARELRCHHCGHLQRVPRQCPDCGNLDLQPFGRGTQRVEEALAERFPEARLLRIDSDSARGRDKLESLLTQVRDGEADILIGTQIMAKGHDFPRLTLVGVLNADAGLFAADYRAGERLFAQLQQVGGRAGRAELPGEVLVQTRYPDHALFRALARHDYAGYAESALLERESAGFPPFVHEAVLRAEAHVMRDATRFLDQAIRLAPADRDSVTLFDAAPMSLARLGGWERAQVVAQSGSRPALQHFLHAWSEALYAEAERNRAVRWQIDVDPIEY
jgi:primosomal protein N' (replication factor Y)